MLPRGCLSVPGSRV